MIDILFILMRNYKHAGKGFPAVSYTHLDVYKRQQMSSFDDIHVDAYEHLV